MNIVVFRETGPKTFHILIVAELKGYMTNIGY